MSVLEAARERANAAKNFQVDFRGKQVVTMTSVIFISIICLLTGGIMGAFSTSLQMNRSRAERVREVMQSFSGVSSEVSMTNHFANTTNMPAWLRAMKPKESHSGISLVVIQ